MDIRGQANRVDTDRPSDVFEGLLAKISELDRDLAVNLIVGGRRDADASRLSDALQPRRDVYAIAEYVIALDEDVPEVNPDPELHAAVLRNAFVPLGHHRLHGHCAFDRIDH